LRRGPQRPRQRRRQRRPPPSSRVTSSPCDATPPRAPRCASCALCALTFVCFTKGEAPAIAVLDDAGARRCAPPCRALSSAVPQHPRGGRRRWPCQCLCTPSPLDRVATTRPRRAGVRRHARRCTARVAPSSCCW
jgi:hypothetical protein